MHSWSKRWQRGLTLVAAITLVVASFLTITHRHADHSSSEARCAVCVVAHHVSTVATAAIALTPPSATLGALAVRDVRVPALPAITRQSGRAPPSSFPA